jgi:uncharacterized protein (DUF58 family)|tara:strand:+ start:10007 stop:10912 length:906 start_codon:yes stop_codon:yes gene_type:complete
MEKKRLNADIAGSISSFQSVMKSFEVKTKLYRTLLKGRGLEFDGYRTYSPEDDASIIDWKATKRTNQVLVKKYIEEKDMKVVFLIDVSENMVSGSTNKLKCEYSAEIIAALTNLIINSGSKVGYLFFNSNIEEFVSPARDKSHFARFMDVLTDASTYGGEPNLGNALDYSMEYIDKSVLSLVIISDFINVNNDLKEKLNMISKRFETIALMIRDPLDKTLPDISGELIIEDASSGERILINPSLVKGSYEKYASEQEDFVKESFKKTGIDFIELVTDKPFISSLVSFIRERVKITNKNVAL